MKLKKLLILILMFVMATFAIFAQNNIAVSTFDITGGAVSTEEAEAITELFIAELVSTGKVTVVDRANFDKIIKEMKFQASDWSNSEKTAALGNAVNATMVARGQIIKLGSKMYLTSTIIDLKTAIVLSSARKQFDSIDNIFDLLPTYTKKLAKSINSNGAKTYEIGDVGPGGGTVFYIEGTLTLEVSPNLGAHTWYNAQNVAKEYNGGGFNDWYLPTKTELNFIYQNLVETGILNDTTWHWSTSQYSDNLLNAWLQSFSGGYQYNNSKYDTHSVRAVRAFTF